MGFVFLDPSLTNLFKKVQSVVQITTNYLPDPSVLTNLFKSIAIESISICFCP